MNHTTNPQDAKAEALLLHFAAEAHRRKWSYDRGLDDDGVPIKSEAFDALHRLGEEMRTALEELRRAPAVLPSAVVSADRATLRAAVVEVLRPHASLGGTPPRYEVPLLDGANPRLPRISGWKALDDVADAVLAVLPDQAEWDALCREAGRLRRASAEMAERAERIEADVQQARADRATLRDRISDTVMPFLLNFSDEESARINATEVADALLAVLPAPAPLCICGHSKQQHFEDACITEITGCNCGDYLEPQDAAEVIDRWRQAALQARTADRATLLREAADHLARQADELWMPGTKAHTVMHADADELRRLADDASRVAAEEQPAETQDGEVDADTVAKRAAQVISTMGADIRTLTQERNRYRNAWHNARARAADAEDNVRFTEEERPAVVEQPDTAEHVCKPGAARYFCPTSGKTESTCHGGFDVCCDRPDLHQLAGVERPDTQTPEARRCTHRDVVYGRCILPAHDGECFHGRQPIREDDRDAWGDGLCDSEYPGDESFAGQLCALPERHFGDHRRDERISGTSHAALLRWPNRERP